MDKRGFLKLTGFATAVTAVNPVFGQTSAPTSNCTINENPATFVLIAGANMGGWHFAKVAKILQAQGHTVYRPSLPGLAEHRHLLSPDINLSSHIADITSLIEIEELTDIVLVGHSYGGMVITGVADRMPDKISSIVYLDAFMPEDGEGTVDLMLEEGLRQAGENLLNSGIYAIPPNSESPNIFGSHDFLKETAQPIATMLEPISLTGAYKTIPKKTFVWASRSPIIEGTKAWYDRVAKDPSWRTEVYEGNHNIQWEDPEICADMLLRAI